MSQLELGAAGGRNGRASQVMPVGLRPRRIGAGRSQEEAVNEVDLANQLVEEVAASESEMVRQTMDQVIQSTGPSSHPWPAWRRISG